MTAMRLALAIADNARRVGPGVCTPDNFPLKTNRPMLVAAVSERIRAADKPHIADLETKCLGNCAGLCFLCASGPCGWSFSSGVSACRRVAVKRASEALGGKDCGFVIGGRGHGARSATGRARLDSYYGYFPTELPKRPLVLPCLNRFCQTECGAKRRGKRCGRATLP